MNAAIMLEEKEFKSATHQTKSVTTHSEMAKEEKNKTHPIPTKSVPNNGTAQCTLLAFCAVHP